MFFQSIHLFVRSFIFDFMDVSCCIINDQAYKYLYIFGISRYTYIIHVSDMYAYECKQTKGINAPHANTQQTYRVCVTTIPTSQSSFGCNFDSTTIRALLLVSICLRSVAKEIENMCSSTSNN